LASLQQILVLALTYIEGTGRRHAAWRANFWIEVAAGVAFLLPIAVRAELWALAVLALVRAGAILVLFAGRYDIPGLRGSKDPIRRRLAIWREQLWPMQWKNLVNNLVGVLTTRLLTPLLLATQGATAAGRVGLALTFAGTIIAITSAWPLSQTALYSALYHQGRGRELIAVFYRTWLASLLLAAFLCLGGGVLFELTAPTWRSGCRSRPSSGSFSPLRR
jgi:hypothetical protein